MKILKKIVIVLVILIAIPLVAALFISGKYDVEREVTIDKPKQEVFDFIKYLGNQEKFSVWAKMDPNSKKGLTGTDGEVGAIASWDSQVDSVGKGEQEIIKITNGERIDFELRFIRPFEATDNAYFTTEDTEGKTIVKWGFDGAIPYPMNLMTLFMDFEKELGPDLQKGLDNLKVLLEEMPSKRSIEIVQEEVTAGVILFISDSCTLSGEEISAKLGSAYGEIMSFIGQNQLEMTGAPIAINNKFSIEDMFYSFDAGVSVAAADLDLTGRIEKATSYEGKVVKATHVGPYMELTSSYEQIKKYLSENNLEVNGRTWEEYIDDPTEVSQEELRTNIYFPIK